jgi:pyruvate,water dikinase
MVREIMLHIGELLYAGKQIEKREDIFYLTIEEIENFKNQQQNYKDLIAKRKQEYKIFAELPNYSKLIFAEQEFDKLPNKLNAHEQIPTSENELHGTPCSSGEVSGEVLIIESPSKQYDTTGKILVTRSTDPGWVFMLSTAKGIISERGSLLSHTAIISRELKIPSVVGVDNATKLLKTGDKITLNGKTGKITIETKS